MSQIYTNQENNPYANALIMRTALELMENERLPEVPKNGYTIHFNTLRLLPNEGSRFEGFILYQDDILLKPRILNEVIPTEDYTYTESYDYKETNDKEIFYFTPLTITTTLETQEQKRLAAYARISTSFEEAKEMRDEDLIKENELASYLDIDFDED